MTDDVQFSVRIPKDLRDRFKVKYRGHMTDIIIHLMRRDIHDQDIVTQDDTTIPCSRILHGDPIDHKEMVILLRETMIKLARLHARVKKLEGE